ncbi:hypothetical protein IscW_ISCW014119 [Ixodes scapularis]|uniref:Uncharacterized protein n=1 Tax=Ixodes scapularis TaxID=6945 RepID=B7QHD4_IXOSC|nr:hypothetical protein IscW_ISCW014119 [Ixodes scapularis]|eukprot:XP_002414591.1 hypothetical protein IscW_ISCW014119 [Ixodes scapularis]
MPKKAIANQLFKMAATTRPRAPLLFTKMLKLCMHFTVQVFVGGEARHCHPDGHFYSSVPPFPPPLPAMRFPQFLDARAKTHRGLCVRRRPSFARSRRRRPRIESTGGFRGLGQVRDAGVPHSLFCPAVIAGGVGGARCYTP